MLIAPINAIKMMNIPFTSIIIIVITIYRTFQLIFRAPNHKVNFFIFYLKVLYKILSFN